MCLSEFDEKTFELYAADPANVDHQGKRLGKGWIFKRMGDGRADILIAKWIDGGGLDRPIGGAQFDYFSFLRRQLEAIGRADLVDKITGVIRGASDGEAGMRFIGVLRQWHPLPSPDFEIVRKIILSKEPNVEIQQQEVSELARQTRSELRGD